MIQYETHMLLCLAAIYTTHLYNTPINYIEGVLWAVVEEEK